MGEPYILAGEDTLMLYRTFKFQLARVGDGRFAAALSVESPDVIAAVGGFIEPRSLDDRPRTQAVLKSVPQIVFPAERVTKEDAARK